MDYPDAPKPTILIVDDTPDNIRLLSQMLLARGYKIRAMTSGARALESARIAPPDLILLDVRMPEMDGYRVCTRLQNMPETREVPVIFISALDDIKDKVRAFSVGGVDYITKPFQVAEVLARVETHLSIQNLHRQLETANRALIERVAALDHANAALEARNEELNAFAHTVAHDLKAPLNLLVGYGDFLVETPDVSPDDRRRYLQTITQSSRKMANIIDELLLLASVRNQGEVQKAPLDMGLIVAETLERLDYMLAARQASIALPDAWPIALGHGPWVEEVWMNYISNAVKYGGEPPVITLGVSRIGDNPDMAYFWVQDNGPGLSPEEQARLFTPFERLYKLRVEGHGLGLSIAHRIIQRLGGNVGVDSTVGQGSRFWFTLPLASNE
ncbi:MAG: hybrid sensor histidine kinase/response regulator [Anaerolineae bacterium]|nr:hybrid sensor histidine kinase/response regulator [Anaerolineae bacterium]